MASVAATGASADDIKDYMHQMGAAARRAAVEIGRAPTALKNEALLAIAEQIDQVEPAELPSSDFALSTEGDLVLQLAEQLTELYYQSKRLIEAINESTKDKAAHYANDLNGMVYKAMTDAKQKN